ncbi:MAG: TetR/AcrR family transcriptional regulator [Pseudomonadota bacterium]
MCHPTRMTLQDFRTERAASKRASILAAAEMLFRQDGFTRASMETIARKAQVSTATLYRYYSSKADLFEAVAAETMNRLELNLSPTSSPDSGLAELARAYARLLSEPDIRGLFRMIVAECGRDKDLAGRFYTAVKARLSDLFVKQIEDGERAGIYRDIPMPDQVAGQLQGMIEHGTLMRGLVLGDNIETMSEADAIADESLATWTARWAK